MSRERRQSESKRRIYELRHQIEEVAGPVTFGVGDCPSDLEQRFLEHVLAFEREDHVPLFAQLCEAGIVLPAPDDLTNQDLETRLWKLIHAMALMGVYLHSTNHLSDRDLYEFLWCEALREPGMPFPHEPDCAMHIDLVGSGSEEDVVTYLRYYADESERRDWAREFADATIPTHEEPPYDRDRLLPQHEWNGQRGEA